MDSEKEKTLNGALYDADDPQLGAERERAESRRYNRAAAVGSLLERAYPRDGTGDTAA